MSAVSRKELTTLLLLLCLAAALVLLMLSQRTAETQSAGTATPLMDTLENALTDTRMEALSGLTTVKKRYRIADNATVGPMPDADAFHYTQDPAEIAAAVAEAGELLEGQELVWSPELDVWERCHMGYYRDESILAITWQEVHGLWIVTYLEVKIADASQIRRKLADDTFGSEIKKYPTELARECNAVAAISGDFYRFQPVGINIYQGQICRDDPDRMDTCYINGEGNMLFSYPGEYADEAELQRFIEDNDIRFSLSFGPVMLDDGEKVNNPYYLMGQTRDQYARAAIGQMDHLHYLMMSVYQGCNMDDSVALMQEKGCRNAYAVDGGQSATIIFNGTMQNPSQFDSERLLSDIVWFATAVPGKEEHE